MDSKAIEIFRECILLQLQLWNRIHEAEKFSFDMDGAEHVISEAAIICDSEGDVTEFSDEQIVSFMEEAKTCSV